MNDFDPTDPVAAMHRAGIDGINGPSARPISRPQSLAPGHGARGRRHSEKGIMPPRQMTRPDMHGTKGRSVAVSSFQQYAFETSARSKHTGMVDSLRQEGFSYGLSQALASNADAFSVRIWVVDNSGSMQIPDGHRVVTTSDRKIVAQTVTRWEEIQQTVNYHSSMAALLRTPTTFKLLNPPEGMNEQEFTVSGGHMAQEEIRKARNIIMGCQPNGTTPLARHLWDIHHMLQQMAPKLRREGKRAVLVVATDGLPTDEDGYVGKDVDEEFMQALRSLEGLPIWLVVRLCTDEERVRKFYNELDNTLDLPLEVLDDYMGEASEVHKHNKWLNYALPMHRCRELGYHHRVIDFLDERPLTKGEVRSFCALLFGAVVEDIPDPNTDWKEFLQYIQDRLKLEEEQWDPIKKKAGPWIYVKTLHKIYGKGKCIIM